MRGRQPPAVAFVLSLTPWPLHHHRPDIPAGIGAIFQKVRTTVWGFAKHGFLGHCPDTAERIHLNLVAGE